MTDIIVDKENVNKILIKLQETIDHLSSFLDGVEVCLSDEEHILSGKVECLLHEVKDEIQKLAL